jgi:hypothetical protein
MIEVLAGAVGGAGEGGNFIGFGTGRLDRLIAVERNAPGK